MVLPIGAVMKVAKVAAPLLGPEAAKLAKKLVGERKLKNHAHDMAWERGGRVGQVTFPDGVKRWVVADKHDAPLASLPPFGDGAVALAAALRDVDLARCLHAPGKEVNEEKRRSSEHRKARQSEQKATDKAAAESLRAEANTLKEHAKRAAEDRKASDRAQKERDKS